MNQPDNRHVGARRFVLIFEPLESVHLHKDVGQIPYQLQKHFGYSAEIVCRQNEQQYRYIDQELQGLQLTFLTESPYRYLHRNAGAIDVLMLFHISTDTIKLGLLYKKINPDGLLYVKYDNDDPQLRFAAWGNRNPFTQLRRNVLFQRFVKKLDLLSIECRQVFERLPRVPAATKLHLPNGFDPDVAQAYGVEPRSFAEKENLLLLVGRHGSRHKNSELMLRVLSLMEDIGEWSVCFIGPMTEAFVQLKDQFLHNHPTYRKNVRFVGQLDDKRVLFDYYSRAKIFCLPSREESWGLVCTEALYFGNVLLMSRNISSAVDQTDDGNAGFVAESDNADAWAEALTTLLRDQVRLEAVSERARRHFATHFVWKNILAELDGRIRRRMNAGNG